MSTEFSSAESAKEYALCMLGVDPKTVELVEDGGLRVVPLCYSANPDEQAKLEKELQKQKGYRFENSEGLKFGIVVAPFREGFCAWVIPPRGFAQRL